MRKSHKGLIAAMAFALPAGLTIALVGPTAMSGAATPVYPVFCNFGAQVNFSPPLVAGNTTTVDGTYSVFHQGEDTTDPNAVENVTVTGPGGGTNPIQLSNCLSSAPIGSPTSGSITPFSLSSGVTKTFKTPTFTLSYGASNNVVLGSPTVTLTSGNYNTAPAVQAGFAVKGKGMPTGVTVLSVAGSGTSLTLSAGATATVVGDPLTFTDVANSKVQHYQIGACDTFTGGPGGATAKTTLKTLKSLNLSDTWTGQPVWSTGTHSTSFAASGTGFAGNGDGELGFVVFGKTSGDYAANQAVSPSVGKAQISALLEIASGDGLNWSDGCATGTVTTVHIDPATSTIESN